jgi:hypothetical protein
MALEAMLGLMTWEKNKAWVMLVKLFARLSLI